MSKIVVIGDIHCRDVWKQILANEQTFDKVVFVGDYFDTFEETPIKEWINNFSNIMNLRYDYPDQIITLIGNHDYHYVEGVYESYSGYREKHRISIENIIKFHKDNLRESIVLEVNQNAKCVKQSVKQNVNQNVKQKIIKYNF
jgi:predicted phosphodiesterase